MIIRLAMDYDLPAFIEMARANVFETLRHHDFEEDHVKATFYRYLTRANPTIYIVEEMRQPIGFLLTELCSYDFKSGHYLTQKVMYVQPDKRGTRAAALMVEHLIAEAERLGVQEIVGGNDNGFNSERTARFLEHYGFERAGFSMRRLHGRQERQFG